MVAWLLWSSLAAHAQQGPDDGPTVDDEAPLALPPPTSKQGEENKDASKDDPVEEEPVEDDSVQGSVDPGPEPDAFTGPKPVIGAAEREEIYVYGESLVKVAREKVVKRLEDLGYDAVVKDQGEYTVYKNEMPHKGEVRVYDDGWVLVKRQPLRFHGRQMPWAREGSVGAWAGCLVYPWLCLRINGPMVSKRRWMGTETRTAQSILPLAQEYGDRVADLKTERKVGELVPLLELLWERGEDIEGGPTLETHEARRAALFAYWNSRTDNVWGRSVAKTVHAFCEHVVQESEHPFTSGELERFRSQITSSRLFLGDE